MAANASDVLTAPTPAQYVAALREARVTPVQRRMLDFHYRAPARTITAEEAAHALGFNHYSTANLHYGRLGRRVRGILGMAADSIDQRLGMLVTFEKENDQWHWIMRPQVAEALEVLGWVVASTPPLPEEVHEEDVPRLVEGASSRVWINAYERNPEARRRCLEIHGFTCCICGFDFGKTYGEVADRYIHVHHLRPLSEIGAEYVVNPVEDLRPVCPNCHAVLHLRAPAFAIEEVRMLLRDSASPNKPLQPTGFAGD
jgi:putative restriction endonuclease